MIQYDPIEKQGIPKKALDVMQIGVTISDVNGRIIYVNAAEAAMHGYEVEELLGKDVRIFALAKQWRPLDLEKIKSLKKWRRESINVRKDGSSFPVQLMSDVLKGAGQEIIGMITTCEDITHRKRIEDKLRESEQKYRSLVDSTDDSIYLVDSSCKYLFINKKHSSRIGAPSEEYLDRSYGDFHSPEVAAIFQRSVDEVFKTGRSMQREYKSERDDQYFLQTLSPIRDHNGQIKAVTVVSKNITEHRRTEEQVRYLAYFDSLTGLPNRLFFRELLDKAVSLAKQHERLLAILFLDLDDFKRINDTLGHDIGDELLQAIGTRLMKSIRASDCITRTDENVVHATLSRLGGDEFILLLTEIADVQDAGLVARRLLDIISEPYILKGHSVIITSSIGISLYPFDGDDSKNLLKNADLAMYHAKEKGKNNFRYYSESMKTSAFERLKLEEELNTALQNDQFSIHYQASLDARSRKIIGSEALIRWQHPEKALISPSGFIPTAEDTGQIVSIDEWVLRRACLQNKTWQKSGLEPIVVAVNLSTAHFENQKLIEMVKQALHDAQLDPKYLQLEITESKIMKNPVSAIASLNELKEMGIRIALDDFGTGHSSLSYLRQIPLDYVKIDRSFVGSIETSPHDTTIIKSIIALAHSLNFRVIAEGVETEQQMNFLCEHACDQVQGFLFSRPVPAEEFSHILKQGI